MSFQYLLDTNTLSEPARPVPNENILYRLNVHQAEIVTASIVVHELVYGCLRLLESKRRDSLWSYIQESVLSLPILDYDREAALWHGQERARLTRLGKTPAFADGQIASIAYFNDLILVTNNVADFQFFEGLIVENWFSD